MNDPASARVQEEFERTFFPQIAADYANETVAVPGAEGTVIFTGPELAKWLQNHRILLSGWGVGDPSHQEAAEYGTDAVLHFNSHPGTLIRVDMPGRADV